MDRTPFNKIANELNRHWIESVEQITRLDGEIETFVVCTCRDWISVAVTPEEGDPVFEFTRHCTSAIFEIPLLVITALRDDVPTEPPA